MGLKDISPKVIFLLILILIAILIARGAKFTTGGALYLFISFLILLAIMIYIFKQLRRRMKYYNVKLKILH